jgi:hypothetical protein
MASKIHCTYCSSDQVEHVYGPGEHHANHRGKDKKQQFDIFHCNTCGNNFEVTGEWEDE